MFAEVFGAHCTRDHFPRSQGVEALQHNNKKVASSHKLVLVKLQARRFSMTSILGSRLPPGTFLITVQDDVSAKNMHEWQTERMLSVPARVNEAHGS